MPDLDARLRRQNPWWARGSDGVEEDPHLRRLEAAHVRWDPPVLRSFEPRPGDTCTLRGPRQSGKTTTLKRLVARLLELGERRILYHSFDLETQPEAIYRVVERARILHTGEEGPWYLFLDEVTSVEDWQVGLKHAWDVGLTREDFVLATGSSAHDVRRGAEQLPGRRGQGKDLLQLPMSFRDFCRATELAEVPETTFHPADVLDDEATAVLREAYLHQERLERAFRIYRQVGGFPAAVSDWVGDREVRPTTIEDLWRTVSGDVARHGLDQTAALKLLEEVSRCLGSRLPWTDAAEAMDLSGPKGAKRYAHFLAEAFALLVVHFWDRSGGTLRPRRTRKLYFTDPLFGRVPPALVPGAREPDDDATVENLVAMALFRSATTGMVQSTPAPGNVAYWRSSGSGREVDFLVPRRGERKDRFPFEVKGDASTRISSARKALGQSFGAGAVLTRTVWELEKEIPAIPVPTFLACLSERLVRD